MLKANDIYNPSDLYLFIFWINHIIVPPEKPRVYTVDDNKEVRLKLGPYRVGETVRIRWEYLSFSYEVTYSLIYSTIEFLFWTYLSSIFF